MKTILLISPYWREKHRWMVSSYKLAELWQRLGYKVIVVFMGGKNEITEVSPTLTLHSRDDIFLKDPLNFAISFGFAGYVHRLIKKESPDLIICNKILFWSSFSLIPLRLMGHKILLLTDALVGVTWFPRGWIPKIIMSIGAWTMGWLVMLCAERFVTFHPQPKRILTQMGVERKTEVIPTGIDVSIYAEEASDLRPQTSNVTVTYIGRLESIKGVDDFLATITPLKEKHDDLTVQVVGWYKDDHPLVEQYKDHVTFTGLRDDIPEILAKTDIFVLPSYSEGLCNALMEAMSSSCACIATNVGGNSFLIEDGVSGLLFKPGDRQMLAGLMESLIRNPEERQRLGAAAHQRMLKEFDWSVVGKKYQAVFDRMMKA